MQWKDVYALFERAIETKRKEDWDAYEKAYDDFLEQEWLDQRYEAWDSVS